MKTSISIRLNENLPELIKIRIKLHFLFFFWGFEDTGIYQFAPKTHLPIQPHCESFSRKFGKKMKKSCS